MTEKSFNEAKEILRKVEYIEKLRSIVSYYNPLIKGSTDKSDYVYLSWADNENGDLKKIIVDWLDKEKEKFMTEFHNL